MKNKLFVKLFIKQLKCYDKNNKKLKTWHLADLSIKVEYYLLVRF